jgi:hypothetical protein
MNDVVLQVKIKLNEIGIYFKRNTPQLAADGIKGIRIQLRDVSDDRVPFLCGGALHAPPACSGVRRRRLTGLWRILPNLPVSSIYLIPVPSTPISGCFSMYWTCLSNLFGRLTSSASIRAIYFLRRFDNLCCGLQSILFFLDQKLLCEHLSLVSNQEWHPMHQLICRRR